jgi:hypothetical protein
MATARKFDRIPLAAAHIAADHSPMSIPGL